MLICSLDGYSLTYIDEFVDNLLVEERVCDIILPRLTKRDVLEDNGELGPRKSRLLDAMEGKSEHGSERSPSRSLSHSSDRRNRNSRGRNEDEGSVNTDARTPSPTGSGYRSRTPSRSRSSSKSPYRSRSRSMSTDRLNGGSPRYQSRSRSISPDRMET